MRQHVRHSLKSDEVTLTVSATDHGCRSFSPTDRSEWHTGRWIVVGVLVLTLGACAFGLVYASRTQLASVIHASVNPVTPPPTPLLSPSNSAVAHVTIQMAHPQRSRPSTGNQAKITSPISSRAVTSEISLSFRLQGLTFGLAQLPPSSGEVQRAVRGSTLLLEQGTPLSSRRIFAMEFVGAHSTVGPVWHSPISERIGFATDPVFGKGNGAAPPATVHYENIWPGIDLFYTVTRDELRSTFVIKPGADPNQIQFAYSGATSVRRTESGQIEITTPMGTIAEDLPVAYQESRYLTQLARLRNGTHTEQPGGYQERDGQRIEVPVTYTLQSSKDAATWSLHAGAYDPHTPLIIERVIRHLGAPSLRAGLKRQHPRPEPQRGYPSTHSLGPFERSRP